MINMYSGYMLDNLDNNNEVELTNDQLRYIGASFDELPRNSFIRIEDSSAEKIQTTFIDNQTDLNYPAYWRKQEPEGNAKRFD